MGRRINAALLALYAPTSVAAQLHAVGNAYVHDYLHLWQHALDTQRLQPYLSKDVRFDILLSITYRCSMRPPNRSALVPRLITDMYYKKVQEDVMDFWNRIITETEHCKDIKALYEGQITNTSRAVIVPSLAPSLRNNSTHCTFPSSAQPASCSAP